MNIQNLEFYVQDINEVRDIFGLPRLSLLRAEDRQFIAEHISYDISPEVLTCDGELDADEIRLRGRFIQRVADELLSIDPSLIIEE